MASTLREQATKMAEKLDYRTKIDRGAGTGIVEIYGVTIPTSGIRGFSPLDKIWSSVRKRNAEQFGVHTTALFSNEKIVKGGRVKTIILGRLIPNFAGIEDTQEAIDAYLALFEETFEKQVGNFMNALLEFLLDEELGYIAYCKRLQNGNVNEGDLDTLVEAFLRAHDLKIKPDDDEKKRRKKESKKIKSRAEEYKRVCGITTPKKPGN